MSDDAVRLAWLILQHSEGDRSGCDSYYCELRPDHHISHKSADNYRFEYEDEPQELTLARKILAAATPEQVTQVERDGEWPSGRLPTPPEEIARVDAANRARRENRERTY